jgi:hypothetical protein
LFWVEWKILWSETQMQFCSHPKDFTVLSEHKNLLKNKLLPCTLLLLEAVIKDEGFCVLW